MGQVHLGTSRAGRKVAVKLILPELANTPQFRAASAAFGPSTYARALGSGHVTVGMGPDAAQQVATTLTAEEASRKGCRRWLGHGWKGIEAAPAR
ncbi:hypothetical protein [Streptomyces mashuensis]|nr:hypothetical protein [Streptomyces mashuensis]